MVKKYVKKPIVVEAVQYIGINANECNKFCPTLKADIDRDTRHKTVSVPTLEGDMIVSDGDSIIKGIGGEFYLCKPDIFQSTYDLFNDTSITKKQKIAVGLVTSDFRGDHAADIFISFDIDTNITVDELVGKVFSSRTEHDHHYNPNKFTDHIEIRICN